MRFLSVLLGITLLAAPLAAQTRDGGTVILRTRIDAIIAIPVRTDELRRADVSDDDVRSVLNVLVRARVGAVDATLVLTSQRDAVRQNGPVDNFGAFVQSQLAAGRRGRALADAIHAEHRARGKGRPAHAGGQGNRPEGRGSAARSRQSGQGREHDDDGEERESARSGSGDRTGTSRGGSSDAQRAARITIAIRAQPGRIDAVLAAQRITADQFEQLMFRVGADPAQNAEYLRLTAR